MALEQTLWFSKYRPSKLSECVLPKKIKDVFQGYVDKKEVPNLMLVGYQGTGKTTLAKVIVNEFNAESLYIDASTDNGKQMVSELIVPFASTISIVNSDVPKFIILDECLEENETVRIGTIDNYKDIPLKNLEKNREYPVVSMNMETQQLENDTAYVCTDKEDELYKVMLENGIIITCNENHPFVIEDLNGSLIKKRVKDGIVNSRVIFYNGLTTKIISVVSTNTFGRVMDIHVTKNHTFITTNGLVTSNCDYLSSSAQASLRPVIERYALTTRFIFTGNYTEKIIPALKSRCAYYNFSDYKNDSSQLMSDFYNRCCFILNDNNIHYDQKALAIFISKLFPDFRRIINELQSYATGYGKIDEGILTIGNSNEIANTLYPLLKEHKFDECRKWIAESVNSPEDIFNSLYAKMKDFVPNEKQPEIILLMAQYQFWSNSVSNQQINTMAFFTELMQVL